MLISWGGTGHSKISEAAALSFNQQMKDFQSWVSFLKAHASDADYRKSSDKTEGPKHYIDIDSYSDFISKGRIPQTLDSVNQKYGSAFVIDNGILPWATIASFDSLRECMKRRDFDEAKKFAADLGHYVADGHMPLHITKDYDGRLPITKEGIHSRYESTMIGAHISQITYSGEDISEINNVNQYIFNYLYANYSYVDEVYAADTYAKTLGTTSSTEYKTALWTKTKDFTIPLFKNASHALAELIYTAWLQAGSPSLITTDIEDPEAANKSTLEQNSPNPFNTTSQIRYTLKEKSQVVMQVQDAEGNVVSTLVKDMLPMGEYSCEWAPKNTPAGIYYLVMKTGNSVQTKKMLYSGAN